ncbi:MAG: virulence factor, partial [Staphylococcus epidermidis]|nr:virulence factor [Staphylococcus epidermidis]
YIGGSDWDGEFANKVKDVLQIIAEFQNKLNKPLSDHQTALENLSENLDKYDTLAIKEALEKVEI